MAKEKFLLVSLSEDKAKELAQAISNETCRKILDYLAEKEATESELSEKLNVPISTIHYNLQQLMRGNLVTVDEFHYSPKGKEVNHYKLANKYIIIAPKSTYGIKEKLKSILPVALIIALGAGFVQLFTSFFSKSAATFQAAAPSLQEAAKETATAEANNILQKAAADISTTAAGGIAKEASTKAAETAGQRAAENVPVVVQTIQTHPNYALWFLAGALVALGFYLIIDWIRNRK